LQHVGGRKAADGLFGGWRSSASSGVWTSSRPREVIGNDRLDRGTRFGDPLAGGCGAAI